MINTPIPQNTLLSGLYYIRQAIFILLQPGMKRFIIVPMMVNSMIFFALALYVLNHFSAFLQGITGWIPDWIGLSYLVSLINGFVIVLLVLFYVYSFTFLTNLIASPFYGIMAEKIEQRLTGEDLPSEVVTQTIVRTLRRELTKLGYFFSRSIGVTIGLLILAFIPVVNLLVPLLVFLWTTWIISLQYIDYSADNNTLSFTVLRNRLKQQRSSTISFGGVIMLASMIPVLNIVIVPIAVAGGTLFWINEIKATSPECLQKQQQPHEALDQGVLNESAPMTATSKDNK